MLGLLCFLRGIGRSLAVEIEDLMDPLGKFGAEGFSFPISGHDMVEQPKTQGQPACIKILECSTCKHMEIIWEDCPQCGYGHIARLPNFTPPAVPGGHPLGTCRFDAVGRCAVHDGLMLAGGSRCSRA